MTASSPQHALAVDIGGSAIKAAVVDLASGVKLTKRLTVAMPEDSTPREVARAVAALVDIPTANHPEARRLPLGVTIPGTVIRGVVRFVGNLDQSWVALTPPLSSAMSSPPKWPSSTTQTPQPRQSSISEPPVGCGAWSS